MKFLSFLFCFNIKNRFLRELVGGIMFPIWFLIIITILVAFITIFKQNEFSNVGLLLQLKSLFIAFYIIVTHKLFIIFIICWFIFVLGVTLFDIIYFLYLKGLFVLNIMKNVGCGVFMQKSKKSLFKNAIDYYIHITFNKINNCMTIYYNNNSYVFNPRNKYTAIFIIKDNTRMKKYLLAIPYKELERIKNSRYYNLFEFCIYIDQDNIMQIYSNKDIKFYLKEINYGAYEKEILGFKEIPSYIFDEHIFITEKNISNNNTSQLYKALAKKILGEEDNIN